MADTTMDRGFLYPRADEFAEALRNVALFTPSTADARRGHVGAMLRTVLIEYTDCAVPLSQKFQVDHSGRNASQHESLTEIEPSYKGDRMEARSSHE